MTTRRLCLIDGHAVMYRSFFAIPELSTAAGRPTNAVFGFIRMIRQLRQKLQPTHMIAVFDGGTPPRRLDLLSTYKAQRPAMPESLRAQFSIVEDYLDKVCTPFVRIQSEEADDVIATLARKAVADGADVIIVTNDKDMYQLVDAHTMMVPPSDTERMMTVEDVTAKTGVGPKKIVDWLALIGDAADNIAGVPGVGPKTAAKLLQEHGSVAGIYEELSRVKSPGIRNALEQSRNVVSRNVELIRLSIDLACSLDWAKAEVRREDPERLLPFLRELELNSLTKELEKASEKTLF